MTYCSIFKYILRFRPFNVSSRDEFTKEIRCSNLSTSLISTTINTFRPFSIYSVTLVACVSDGSLDLCASSYEKSFQTPGTIPKGLSVPRLKRVSDNAVLIEWLEPLFSNGLDLHYQLLRTSLESNKTDALYFGTSLFFLDIGKNINSKVHTKSAIKTERNEPDL